MHVGKRVLFYIVCDHGFNNYNQQVSSAGRVLNIITFILYVWGRRSWKKSLKHNIMTSMGAVDSRFWGCAAIYTIYTAVYGQ